MRDSFTVLRVRRQGSNALRAGEEFACVCEFQKDFTTKDTKSTKKKNREDPGVAREGALDFPS
jgi:hypothetical protein